MLEAYFDHCCFKRFWQPFMLRGDFRLCLAVTGVEDGAGKLLWVDISRAVEAKLEEGLWVLVVVLGVP